MKEEKNKTGKKWVLLVFLVATLCLIPMLSSTALAFDWGNTVHYYKLDDNVLTDSLFTLNGTDSGSTNVSGIINSSRNFSGSTSVNFTSSYFQNTSVSYSFWIRPENVTCADPGCMIYHMYNDSGYIHDYISIFNAEIYYVFGAKSGSNSRYKTSGSGISTNGSWYHVVINGTGDGGAGRYQIYINGVNQTNLTFASTGTNRSRPNLVSTQSLFAESYSASLPQLQGSLDEFAIFNKTLSTQDVIDLYGQGNGLRYNYYLDVLSEYYNTSVVETSPQIFSIIINKSNSTSVVTPTFYYNNIPYTTGITETVSGSNITYSKTIEVPSINPTIISQNNTGMSTTSSSYVLIKSLTLDTYIYFVNDELLIMDAGNTANETIQFTYNNGTRINLTNSSTSGDWDGNHYVNPFPAEIVQTLEVYLKSTGGVGTQVVFERNLNVTNGNSTYYNNGFYWTFNVSSAESYIYINSTSHSQPSYPLQFGLCNSTITNKFLNFTFKDELNNNILNAKVNSLPVTYKVPGSTTSKTYSFSNQSENREYDFCSYSNLTSMNIQGTINYQGNSSYPARSYGFSSDYSLNSMTNKTLYLLNADDGLYVTFQVVTPALQLLEGVQVQVALSGAVTETKITDTAGSVTFWLNPSSQYNFSFSKTGYSNYSFLLYPTQSSYTVTMGSSSTSDTNNYLEGVSWDISPTETVLDNSTVYTFRFNISSLYWDMSSYGYSLKDQNGAVVAIAKGTTGVGSNLSTNLNVSSNTSITMEYYWIINGNQTNLTREWSSYYTYQGSFSLMNFFDDLRNFSKSGFNDFSRTLIAFFLILVIAGIASIYGVNSPIAIGGLITALVWVFTLGGLIKLSPNAPVNYAAAILVTALFISYWYWEETR